MALLVHEESNVLNVVILIAAYDIEHHAAKLLFHSIHWQLQLANCEQGLFVGICASLVIVEVRESAEIGPDVDELLEQLKVAV